MHDVLRQRVLRKLETLPEAQLYQVLDFMEFLESKYARDLQAEASGLQKFAEKLEDRLRSRTVSPGNLREAFQLIAAADRALSSVAKAGREILGEEGDLPRKPASDSPAARASGNGPGPEKPSGLTPSGGGR